MAWSFNAHEVEPSRGAYEPLPAGEYDMQIIDQSIKPNNNGVDMLSLEMEVTSGDFTGRKHYENLNLWHENETPRRIAIETLSAICRASGVMNLADVEQGVPELLWQPMLVKMKVEARKDRDKRVIPGEFQNRATYVPREGLEASPASGSARQAQNAGTAPAGRHAAGAQQGRSAAGASRPPAGGNGGAAPWRRTA